MQLHMYNVPSFVSAQLVAQLVAQLHVPTLLHLLFKKFQINTCILHILTLS